MCNLSELAKEALAIQDACNMGGVANSFVTALRELSNHTSGTDERNTHAIVRVYLNKMISLAGEAEPKDWNKVHDLADVKP